MGIIKNTVKKITALSLAFVMSFSALTAIKSPLKVDAAFEAKHYDLTQSGGYWDGVNYELNGEIIKDAFFTDGKYTYFLQADGTPMKDRLTYHPDGVHVIYFDKYGHEVFSNFKNVKQSIAGDAVNDLCFFDVYGYMYTNFLTYDQAGVNLYYANPYGVMECNGWFQFAGDAGPVAEAFGITEGTWGYAYPNGIVDPASIGDDSVYSSFIPNQDMMFAYNLDDGIDDSYLYYRYKDNSDNNEDNEGNENNEDNSSNTIPDEKDSTDSSIPQDTHDTDDKDTEQNDNSTAEDDEKNQILFNGKPASDLEVTLYAISRVDDIPVPDDYDTQFKLEITGVDDPELRREEYGSWMVYSLDEDGYTPEEIYPSHRDVKIRIYVNRMEYYTLTIHYISVEQLYFDEIIDNIVSETITNEMTEYQKLEAFTVYIVENYEYRSDVSGWKGMLYYGGGDCWANSALLVQLCREVGITARTHVPDVDYSWSHVDVVAKIGDTVYEVEAGYDGECPRAYDIDNLGGQYVVGYVYEDDERTDDVYLIEYIAFEEGPVEIPETIRGRKVVSIGSNAFYDSFREVTKITIPSTVKDISDRAFSGLYSSVKIEIDKDNPYFEIVDDVLYTKDHKILQKVLYNNKDTLVVPDTVTRIEGYATSNQSSITKVILNDNLKEIGRAAFRYSLITEITLPEGLEVIEDGAFMQSGLKECVIPASVTKIGTGAFTKYDPITVTVLNKNAELGTQFVYKTAIIKGYKGSTAEAFAEENDIEFIEIE